MKEPLAWFILIGVILFIADRYSGPQPVVVDDAVRNQIASLWETQMGTAPTDKELESLIHNWVREEVFHREAVRLGLESEDTIIRRRLVQKLTFLIQDVDENDITRADLEAHYESNPEDYTLPVRYSISQIFFSNMESASLIETALAEGADWKGLGESTLLPRELNSKSVREVTSTFGSEFAEQLDRLQEDSWVGPLKSTFGLHYVRLNALSPQALTPLPYIERQVMTDLLHERREASLDDYYQNLLDQYEVQYR